MNRFQNILEDADYPPRSYSGRGMYGKTCLAVEVDGNIGQLFSDVLEVLNDRFEMDRHALPSDFKCAREAFRNMQKDSLGMGTIVYFPEVPYECSHEETYCNDRSMTVCKECGEELGR